MKIQDLYDIENFNLKLNVYILFIKTPFYLFEFLFGIENQSFMLFNSIDIFIKRHTKRQFLSQQSKVQWVTYVMAC